MNMDIPPKPSGQEEPRDYPPITIGDREINIHMCVAKLKEGPEDFEQIAADIFDYCMFLLKIPEEYWRDNRHGENAKRDLLAVFQKRMPFGYSFSFTIPETGGAATVYVHLTRTQPTRVQSIKIGRVSKESFRSLFPHTPFTCLQ